MDTCSRWEGGFQHLTLNGSVIRLYDFVSGELKALLKGHNNAIFGLTFSPDGKKLISA